MVGAERQQRQRRATDCVVNLDERPLARSRGEGSSKMVEELVGAGQILHRFSDDSLPV
jgi:hypothetical protein